jgi:hypothetical protein
LGYRVHTSLLDFVLRSKSPNPLEKLALKVPLFKGDLGGFTPISHLTKDVIKKNGTLIG